ncbi:hypothetical protein BCON_0088g00290 [Botryotinia convoluta]|uniref:Uncharacterized protein n=1 Tax=Botryotinia convoluta TaxID=54673 RepID=A0A4Z1I1Z5_9HELO|nr:hypothetical protein BCON_0088g00290 [Botryotinia convoluta]
MTTPSYDPRIDAIDAWSSESNAFRANPSDPRYPGSLDPNTIQIPDPPIFNPNPNYSRYPSPYFGIPYAEWEQEMKEKLKAYSGALFSIRMAYVLSRLGEKPRAYLELRMSVDARYEFKDTDEMFEVLDKVYGGPKDRANAGVLNVDSDNEDGVVRWRERSYIFLVRFEEQLLGEDLGMVLCSKFMCVLQWRFNAPAAHESNGMVEMLAALSQLRFADRILLGLTYGMSYVNGLIIGKTGYRET